MRAHAITAHFFPEPSRKKTNRCRTKGTIIFLRIFAESYWYRISNEESQNDASLSIAKLLSTDGFEDNFEFLSLGLFTTIMERKITVFSCNEKRGYYIYPNPR